jgi:multidrug efflux pump
MTSASYDGQSTITLEFHLDRDIDAAANDVRDRVSGVLDNLPEEAMPPEVRKSNSDEQVIFWAHLVGENMSALELTDYARRYLEDRFAVLSGVARVRIRAAGVFHAHLAGSQRPRRPGSDGDRRGGRAARAERRAACGHR